MQVGGCTDHCSRTCSLETGRSHAPTSEGGDSGSPLPPWAKGGRSGLVILHSAPPRGSPAQSTGLHLGLLLSWGNGHIREGHANQSWLPRFLVGDRGFQRQRSPHLPAQPLTAVVSELQPGTRFVQSLSQKGPEC